jgi:predicted nucleic acid-binding protein
MGIVENLINKKVFLDTAPIIYYIENQHKYRSLLDNLFELNAQGKIAFISSSLTVMEVLVQPIRLQRLEIAKNYLKILTSSNNFEILDLTISISKKAAELRAKYNFKTPDAIQLATAIESRCDFFLTNDIRLEIDEIKSIFISKIT